MSSERQHDAASGRIQVSRRHFLKLSLAAATSLAVTPAFAKRHQLGEKALSFYNLHTGETLRTAYWAQGRYLREGLRDINRILRDFRTDEVETIDTRLIDLLYSLQQRTGSRKPFNVISGYRSPATNAMLNARSIGVAKKSLHMQGMAIDVSLPDRSLHDLRRAALDMGRGGVGYYPASDFVHLDVGKVRSW